MNPLATTNHRRIFSPGYLLNFRLRGALRQELR